MPPLVRAVLKCRPVTVDYSAMEAITFAGVLGAIVGSFLNVVAYRLPRHESLITPASRCTGCGSPKGLSNRWRWR